MRKFQTVVTLFAIATAISIMSTVRIYLITPESVDAWHFRFDTKKECTNFFKPFNGSAGANVICNKIIPHE